MPPRRLLESLQPPTPPPPPLSSVLEHRTSIISSNNEDHGNHGDDGINPSLIFIGGIVVFVFVVSISLHLLLRYFHRRCSSVGSDDDGGDDDDDVAVHVAAPEAVHGGRSSASRVAPEEDESRHSLLDSLPLFAFSALRRSSSSSSATAAAADCAVCLSKFEPHDLLRLLPICCHAFHARCIDTWLVSNQTCPLCRSTIFVDESDVDGMLKRFGSSAVQSSGSVGGDQSFRIEIGSVSRRRVGSESGEDRRRSYSMGSFDYVIDGDDEGDDRSEIVLGHRRGVSTESGGFGGKKREEVVVVVPPSPVASRGRMPAVTPPGADLAAEVAAGGRGWLRDYVDRIALSSSSSSFSSFRLSGRFFSGSGRRTADALSGSSRRSEGLAATSGGGSLDLDRNGLGEEIGNFFRWLSWV